MQHTCHNIGRSADLLRSQLKGSPASPRGLDLRRSGLSSPGSRCSSLTKLRTLGLPMAGLVAMEANQKPLGALPSNVPLLAALVASTGSTRPIVTLAALYASTVLRTSRPRIGGLNPLGCRLRLSRPPVCLLRLGLLPSLSLQLDLTLPGIRLKLSKSMVSGV